MKIWVIGREYPTQKNRMRGSFELEQAVMLTRENEVFYPYVDLHSVRHWRKWGFTESEKDGVTICRYNIPIGKVPKKIKNRIEYLSWKRVLKKMEDKGLPDIIHVHYPAMFYYSLMERYSKKGVKIVCTEHWTQVLIKQLSSVEMDSLKWFTENASFICVGEKLKQSVEELTETRHNIYVIPDTYPSFFYPSTADRTQKETFEFIAIGRLVRVKQFDVLLKAFQRAFGGNLSVILKIVGDGEEREKLQTYVKKHELDRQVLFLGTRKRQEIAALIRDSDALVCSSRVETFGVPVIEAMACGKPFVATKALGFRTGLSEKCGCIVEEDEEAIAAGIRYVYQNYKNYDPQYIAGVAQNYFSEEAVSHSLREVYNEQGDMVPSAYS
nr:glycosyltransferase [uncultured Blautia sp.]